MAGKSNKRRVSTPLTRLADRQRAALIEFEEQAIRDLTLRTAALKAAVTPQADRMIDNWLLLRESRPDLSRTVLLRQPETQEFTARLSNEFEQIALSAGPELDQQAGEGSRVGVEHAVALAVFVAISTDTRRAAEIANMLSAVQTAPLIGEVAGRGGITLILRAASLPGANTAVNGAIEAVAAGATRRTVFDRLINDGIRRTANYYRLAARDMIASAYREGSQFVFDHSGGLVRVYKRYARKGSSTCLACLMLDGEVYETDELLEVHPLDRCLMIPVLTGLPEPQWMNGRQWLNLQPEAQQREIMGEGAWEAWDRGEVSLDDFVRRGSSDHGPTLQVTPLKDILGA